MTGRNELSNPWAFHNEGIDFVANRRTTRILHSRLLPYATIKGTDLKVKSSESPLPRPPELDHKLPAQSSMSLDDIGVADGVDDTRGRLLLQLHGAASLADGPEAVVVHPVVLQQLLELDWLLVAQVEEAVAGVVGVESELGAVAADPALGPHYESHSTAAAKLVLALAACEVHATYVVVE
jgi:hypothetical protein